MIVAICDECGEDLDPKFPEAHICWEEAGRGDARGGPMSTPYEEARDKEHARLMLEARMRAAEFLVVSSEDWEAEGVAMRIGEAIAALEHAVGEFMAFVFATADAQGRSN